MIPGYRKYCSRDHHYRDRTGKPLPSARTGWVISCERCGEPIGYRPLSRIKRSKHHVCRACLPAWRREHLSRRSWAPIYGECGHPVSKRGIKLCISCHRRQGRLKTPEAARVLALIDRLEARGVGYTKLAVAREAKVSRATVYYALARARRRPPEIPICAEGSPAGYRRHKRMDEASCLPCREAWRAYRREAYARRKGGEIRRRPPAAHGTIARYQAHLRDGEDACDACREAWRAYMREYRRKAGEPGPGRGGRPRGPIRHGTAAGCRQHRYHGEDPCDACREAWREYAREYKRKRKARDASGERRAVRN